MRVHADLSHAEAPITVDYGTGDGWEPTRYQTADVRHNRAALRDLAQSLAEEGIPVDDPELCQITESYDTDRECAVCGRELDEADRCPMGEDWQHVAVRS
jgi:hypothetical protein